MIHTVKLILAGVAAVITMATALLAHVPGVPPGETPGVPNMDMTHIPGVGVTDEQLFINEAGGFIALEYQMGELALTKSNNVSVQAYARRIVGDQARLQDELSGLVRRLHVAAPAESSLRARALDQLASYSGPEFDRAYMRATVSNHEAAVATFQNEAMGLQPRGVTLTPLANWAQNAIPVLNDELTVGQSLAQAVGAERAGGSPMPR